MKKECQIYGRKETKSEIVSALNGEKYRGIISK
jgi:hypothetical protein